MMSHFNKAAGAWNEPKKVRRAQDLYTAIKKELELGSEDRLDVMDFGCGTGLLGFQFRENAKSLLGIDNSEGMLEVFDRESKDFLNSESMNIDLEEEGLSRKFDLIVSSMTFHHLNRPEEMILKFSKMLNQKGRIAIVDLETEDGNFHSDNEAMGVKHHGFSKEQLSSWAKKSNLNLSYSIVSKIDKNEKSYDLFLGVFNDG